MPFSPGPSPVLSLVPMHMGALHPFEQALTLVLAFGPFVVLGIVVWLRRRADDAEDDQPPGGPPVR